MYGNIRTTWSKCLTQHNSSLILSCCSTICNVSISVNVFLKLVRTIYFSASLCGSLSFRMPKITAPKVTLPTILTKLKSYVLLQSWDTVNSKYTCPGPRSSHAMSTNTMHRQCSVLITEVSLFQGCMFFHDEGLPCSSIQLFFIIIINSVAIAIMESIKLLGIDF